MDPDPVRSINTHVKPKLSAECFARISIPRILQKNQFSLDSLLKAA